MSGTLYVVATPIGNRDDITLRALSVLRQVAIIASEDTRVTRTLLRHHGIESPRLVSCHDHNERDRVSGIVHNLESGDDVALLSDAGTPLLSDPGYVVVRDVISRGLPVCVVPGASAAIAALVVSGLPANDVRFVGFLPRAEGPRRAAYAALASSPTTLVLYESPHRIVASLTDALEAFGDRRAVLAIGLTKATEQVVRGNLTELLDALSQIAVIRGEMTVVVDGLDRSTTNLPGHFDEAVRSLLDAGVAPTRIRDALALVVEAPRNAVYERVLAVRATASMKP